MAWNSSGTVSVSTGSTTLIGTGTNWIRQGQGWQIWIRGEERPHEVAEVISSTELRTRQPVERAAASGLAFVIIPTQGLNVVVREKLEQTFAELANAQAAWDAVVGNFSATTYQLWLDQGNSGTIADFLASLVGPAGPRGIDGVDGAPGAPGTPGADGIPGTNGVDGQDGWTPSFSLVSDGDRRVLRVVDWVGGTGAKPAIGQYVGSTGLLNSIANAVDLRGSQGLIGDVGPPGDLGAPGDNGWSPVLASAQDGQRRVFRVVDWVGGTGTKPAVGSYLGATGFVANINDALDVRGATGAKGDQGDVGVTGDTGAQGDPGWTPIFNLATDGVRRVLRVADWIGGVGAKPAVGDYVGLVGLVSDIANAVDLRGPAGVSGSGTGDVLAANNLADLVDPGLARTNLGLGSAAVTDASDYALSAHQHPVSDITGLGSAASLDVPATGDATAAQVVLGSDSRLTDPRVPEAHQHPVGDITGLGSAASLDVPATGDATAAQVVLGADGRLSDARPPLPHQHSVLDIAGLGSAAVEDVSEFATAAQGALAATSLQPADASAFATAAQGAKADTALQSADLPSVATQAEAEAGTGTAVRLWTPARINQAIAALGSAGGGGAFDPHSLSIVTTPVVSVIVSLPSGYESHCLRFTNVRQETNNDRSLYLQFSTDGGSTFIDSGSFYDSQYVDVEANRRTSTSSPHIRLVQALGQLGLDPDGFVDGTIIIHGAAAATKTRCQYDIDCWVEGDPYGGDGSGVLNSTAVVTHARMTWSNSETLFSQGRFSVFGVKEAA